MGVSRGDIRGIWGGCLELGSDPKSIGSCLCARCGGGSVSTCDAATMGSTARRMMAQWLGWRSPPAPALVRSWPSPWQSPWCLRCGVDVPGPRPVHGCAACDARRVPWAGVVRLGNWQHWGDTVAMFKLRRRHELGIPMGRLLARVIRVEFPQMGHRAQAVVPAPSHFWRTQQRGMDPPDLLACGVASGLHVPRVRGLRRGRGPRQTGRPQAQRRAARIPGLRTTRAGQRLQSPLILVDDVLTTGRTAASLCRATGCTEVLMAVIAVANAPGWGRA